MAESEKKVVYDVIGHVSVDGRFLRIDFFGADGKTIDVEKRCFAFLGDVSQLILGMHQWNSVRLFKWRDVKKKV